MGLRREQWTVEPPIPVEDGAPLPSRAIHLCRTKTGSVEQDEGVERAKEVCGTCVVRQQCLEFALANRESEGIWGGATEKERRRILRQRRKTAAA